ncbi:hypothetical protein PoB_006433900 [Plakobranchus ocellatus]|uniref:HTH psq-type domain-containing protein n=1 Tax=Plakobranchus ocellatus TaxID=259542 RepID=A0AAV4D161_9GAST|nr:hypothetical protein PoB_006433900 [Plakobranchus ocellatus]
MRLVKSGKLSLNKASKIFGIPYATLGDKIRGRCAVDPTLKLLLTLAEEERLAIWIKEMTGSGFGKTLSEIKDIIKQMLDERNAKTRTPDKRPATAVPEQLNGSEIPASPPTETEVLTNAAPTSPDVSANRLKALKDLISLTAEWDQTKTEEMWTAYDAKKPQCDQDFQTLVTLVLAETPTTPTNVSANRDKPVVTKGGEILKLPSFPRAPVNWKRTILSLGITAISSEEHRQLLRRKEEE